jgi:hypothetical protein
MLIEEFGGSWPGAGPFASCSAALDSLMLVPHYGGESTLDCSEPTLSALIFGDDLCLQTGQE